MNDARPDESRQLQRQVLLVTSHQAFFTREAMENIAKTTLNNLADFETGRACPNLVKLEGGAAKI